MYKYTHGEQGERESSCLMPISLDQSSVIRELERESMFVWRGHAASERRAELLTDRQTDKQT